MITVSIGFILGMAIFGFIGGAIAGNMMAIMKEFRNGHL
jgi:hypothetical protein